MAKMMVLAVLIFVVFLNIVSVPSSSAVRLLGNNNKTNISTIKNKVKSYMLQNGLGHTPPMGYVIHLSLSYI
jgi:hypothetical protein